MAVAGGASNGQWLSLDGDRLTRGRIETTLIAERDFDAAVARILAGERVHVDVYRSLHMRVADEVTRRLRTRVDDVTHGLLLAGAVE